MNRIEPQPDGPVLEKIQGQELEVATIEGADGPFQIAFAGGTSEDFVFFYRDRVMQFFFGGFPDYEHGCAEVVSASDRFKSGRRIAFRKPHSDIVRKNLEMFFQTRVALRPWVRISPAMHIVVNFLPGNGL